MTPVRELPTGSFKRALIGVLRGENTAQVPSQPERGLRASISCKISHACSSLLVVSFASWP